MRTKALLCRLRQLHCNMSPLHLPAQTGSSALRPMSSLVSLRGISPKVADSGGARWVSSPHAATCSGLVHAKGNVGQTLGSVRFMGVGSHKEGNRSGQHGAHYPHAKADGSPEKAEADAREQFLEKAKAESASNIDEPFRDAVESGQRIEEATTELQFGVKDGKNTSEATSHASEELFKRYTINARSGESAAIKEEDKRKYPEHTQASSEAWKSKDQSSEFPVCAAFIDPVPDEDSNPVDFRGREDESVLGMGGLKANDTHTDKASGSEERARENIDKTRREMRAGKARSPQAGVIVGNVPPAGANAIETEPGHKFRKIKKESADKTLENAQTAYEKAKWGYSLKDLLKGFEGVDLKLIL